MIQQQITSQNPDPSRILGVASLEGKRTIVVKENEHTSQRDLQQTLEIYSKWFRQHPEPSYREYETTRKIRKILDDNGITVLESGLKTGLIAVIHGELKGPGIGHVVAVRGDIDALPIQEQTGLPYASLNEGYMHGCGHDYNMTIAIGAALVINKRRATFSGTIKVILQPAEEIGPDKDRPTGSVTVLNTGVLSDVEVFYGTHDANEAEPGTVLITPGPISGAVDKFRITVRGRGAHAAHPQGGLSPIRPVANIIEGIQAIAGQDVDPVHPRVVTVTHVEAGSTWNVVPAVAFLEGTARAAFPEDRTIIHDRLQAVVNGVAGAYGVVADFEWEYGAPPVVNDPRWAALAASTAKDLGLTVGAPHPSLGGEDFSYYLQQAPGAFLRLGVGNADRPMHGPTFYPKLNALASGANLLAEVALRTLEEL